MLAASELERTRTETRLAYLDRCSAACPAEFPPPTTTACLPAIACACTVAAP